MKAAYTRMLHVRKEVLSLYGVDSRYGRLVRRKADKGSFVVEVWVWIQSLHLLLSSSTSTLPGSGFTTITNSL